MTHDPSDRPRTHPFVVAGVILLAVAWSLLGRPVVRDGVYLNLVGAVFCGSLAAMLSLIVMIREKSDTASKFLALVVLVLSSPLLGCLALGGVTRLVMVGP